MTNFLLAILATVIGGLLTLRVWAAYQSTLNTPRANRTGLQHVAYWLLEGHFKMAGFAWRNRRWFNSKDA